MPGAYNAYQEVPQADRDIIWKNAFFVLDTNILLQLFDVTPEAANQQFEALDAIKDRLWFPHQVVHEFLLHQGERAYARVKIAKNAVDSFRGFQNTYDTQSSKMTAAAEPKKVLGDKLRTFVESCKPDLDKLIDDSKVYVADVKQEISALLETRSGRRPTSAELLQRTTDIEARFRLQRGPGYRDTAKDGYGRWMGDTLIWLEVIDHAKAIGKPLILCTNDGKDDWWHHTVDSDGSEVVMPQPHLAEEVQERSGQAMLMYRSSEFYSELRARKLSSSNPSKSIKRELDAAFYRSAEEKSLIEYAVAKLSSEDTTRRNSFLAELARVNEMSAQSIYLDFSRPNHVPDYTRATFERELLMNFAKEHLSQYRAPTFEPASAESLESESDNLPNS